MIVAIGTGLFATNNFIHMIWKLNLLVIRKMSQKGLSLSRQKEKEKMLSVLEIKRKLPKLFVEKLYENYTPLTIDKILAGMAGDRNTTLRVNNIKSNIQEVMKRLKENGIKFERVPWYIDALVIKNVKEKQIQDLKMYEAGEIYLQSLSSMVPPLVLNPKLNEKVLDLTAAPGSKTTQMAAMMQNKGYILANELDALRCERLKYNVEKQGATIIEINNGRGEVIGKKYEGYFDKVLLDAPCSGEGRFLANDAKTYRNWSEKTVKELAKLQKKLLKSAYQALKHGGELVYSTCTLNREENEEILEWAISELEGLRLKNINLDIKNTVKGISDNKEIEKAIKILPSKDNEGFFVAKFILERK